MSLKRLLASLALAIGIGFPTITSAQSAAQAGSPSLSAQMLTIINTDRQHAGLSPLHTGRKLAQVALAHSLDMADHGYLSHFTPQGASPFDRMTRAGIRYIVAGENIGVDTGATQEQMLQAIEVAMLKSPEHRANLLRPTFTRVGIGIALLGNTLYVTEDFKH